MGRKGFWSRLFSKRDPEPQPEASASSPQPTEPTPEPEQPPAQAQPPKQATDGETRVSGSNTSFTTDQASDLYAQALFELADEAGALSEVTEEVEQLGEILAANPELISLLSSPALGREERGGVIANVFKGKVSDTVYKFLRVLNRKDRLASLPGVTTSFGRLVAERNGIVEVDAYVAQRLDDASAKQVADSIGAALGGKQVVLHQYVDESLIGGLKIRVGDQLIDASVATKLTKMKRDLISAGREKARQAVASETE